MGKCTANNASITKMTAAMGDLKSLMSGGTASIAGMETAQAKIKEGFDVLSGKNTGPVTLTYCEGFDETKVDGYDPTNSFPDSPSSEAACIAAGGTWVTKEVENFSFHDELAKLNNASSKSDFGNKIADLKKKFGEHIPDLSEQISKLSPEAGQFASIPSPGEEVESCVCVGGDPLAATQEECELSGGTWECKKAIMPDINGILDLNTFGSFNQSDKLKSLDILPEKLKTQVSNFISTPVPTIDTKKICKLCENVEVKDKVVIDPTTGKQTVEKAKEVPAVNPKVAEEAPAPSKPSAPIKNELSSAEKMAIKQVDNALQYAYDTLYKGSKSSAGGAKGFDKLVKDYKDAHIYWWIQEFAKAVNGDTNIIIHASKAKVTIIFAGEAEAAAKAWFAFLNGSDLKRSDIDELKTLIYDLAKEKYSETNDPDSWVDALKMKYNQLIGASDAKKTADLAALSEATGLTGFADVLGKFNLGSTFSGFSLNEPLIDPTTFIPKTVRTPEEQAAYDQKVMDEQRQWTRDWARRNRGFSGRPNPWEK